jgi:2-C-methyl-D-erythritol 4-phosphate cytidylyltransferase/2-C-methyl-D-erythritol 2,4-cyclodiphosphate synthase
VSQGTRVGIGYDIHRVEAGRQLVLGGVTFPGESGLAGHSDADVLIHAIIDALLGAAGLGDIGTHFPDDDERWDGASSLDLLQQTASMLKDAGAAVSNMDATVIAERPRLAGRIADMRTAIAGSLGVQDSLISVKATTNEGFGPIGRGEGIAAMAVATIYTDA